MLLDRVVKIPVARELRQAAEQEEDLPEEDLFKVLTCPLGYASHYRGIDRRANCKLEWRGNDKALGEHSLVLVATAGVKKDKELLYDYGHSHAVGRKRLPGPKRKEGAALPPAKRAKAKAKGEVKAKAGASGGSKI